MTKQKITTGALTPKEKEAKLSPTCPRCGKFKEHGEYSQIVCTNCWTTGHYSNLVPFKYYQGTFIEWLKL